VQNVILAQGETRYIGACSDQGPQCASESFADLMAERGMDCFMSRSGDAWDRATKEGRFSSLTIARTAPGTDWTRHEAPADVFDDIERFYSPTRRLSTLGCLEPVEFQYQT